MGIGTRVHLAWVKMVRPFGFELFSNSYMFELLCSQLAWVEVTGWSCWVAFLVRATSSWFLVWAASPRRWVRLLVGVAWSTCCGCETISLLRAAACFKLLPLLQAKVQCEEEMMVKNCISNCVWKSFVLFFYLLLNKRVLNVFEILGSANLFLVFPPDFEIKMLCIKCNISLFICYQWIFI